MGVKASVLTWLRPTPESSIDCLDFEIESACQRLAQIHKRPYVGVSQTRSWSR